MKHNSLISANGLLHNPLASTTVKSSFLTAIFKPLLMLFLLVMGSSVVWGDCTFTQGKTIYLNCASSNWDESSATFKAKFYNSSSEKLNESWLSSTGTAHVFSIQVPVSNAAKIKIERWSSDQSSSWGTNIELTAETAGNNDCVYCTAYAKGEWRTQGSGSITTGCGGGDPSPIETHYIAGEGWSGSTWAQKDLTMTALGSDMAYYFIPAEKITGQIKFKLNPESSNSGWDKQLNSNAIDNSQTYSNIKLTPGDDQRMTISTTITGDKKNDIYVFTNGTKVWAIAVPIFSSQLPNENTAKPYTMMDLRLNDGNNEWKSYETATRFTDKADNDNSYTKHTLAYIIPAVGSGETDASGAKVRIEYYDGSKTCKKSNKDPGIAITSSPKRAIVLWDGSSTSPADPLIVDYPVRKSGWKVYVNGSLAGTTDANGDVLVSNLSAGDVTFYLTNGETSKLYQGINWFGGLYIKRSSCSGVSLGEQQYGKGSGKNGVYKKPIVASYNPTGKFTLSQASDVTFNFDGGDITITATEPTTPPTTYTVTLHPNNGGSNIERTNVPEGSNSSAAALNLAAVNYGVGTATWYTNPECTTPFNTVTGNMDLYAKWGVSGNYYVVGDLWMYNSAGDWDNNKGQLMTNTNGVCTVTYTAPEGLNRIEIIKDRDWYQKINGGSYSAVLNASSPISLSVNSGHIVFTLTEAKQVTITFDGKVSVSATDYSFNQTVDWCVKTSDSGWGNNPNSWDHSNVMTKTASGASIIIPNVPANIDHSFMITRGSDEQAAVGTYNFNALWLDTSNPSSGLTWNMQNTNIGDRQLAQTDNEWRNCSFRLSVQSDLRITFDGGKIRCDIVAPNTVTFNSNGGSAVAPQEVSNGGTASEPSAPTKEGYTFVKWQLNGVDYHFTETVTEDITLDAIWVYKAISSVVLNESTHMTWVGNSDFALTPTLTPSDAIAKSVAWSSNATGVATVSDGTVHAVAAGEARITCTITDQFDQQVSAYCDVTVAACEMATENLYSMRVTGYESKIGDNADLSGLWNESSDNTEPATFRIVKLKLSNNYYIYDDNGTVKMSTDASLATAQWYEIPTNENFSPNWTGSSFALYEFKNVSTGRYMRRGNGRYGNNDAWYYYTTLADSRTTDGNQYKFFYDNTMDTHLVCRDGADYNEGNTITELRKAFAIHNNNLNWPDGYSGHCAAPMVICGYTNDPQNNTYTKLHETVEVNPSYPNPNYKASQMNGSYYRIKENATVRANLGGALVPGAVITVRLYADAATTVKLQKTDGTEIETINLSADAELEYSYTVASNSALLDENAFVIKAADNHAGIASIVVTRTYAVRLAQLIEETEIGGTLTLTCDYATDNAVIDKAITINGGGHTIGDLKIELSGDLTLSGALTVNDFSIYAQAGNSTNHATSGQVRNATNLTVNGNAYFYYTIEPGEHVQHGWYDFTVPFPVNTASGIKGIQNAVLNDNFAYGTDYAILEHLGDKQAAGEYAYKKFQGVMAPCRLYSITLDDDYNYKTLRMQKTAEGPLVASDNVTLHEYLGDGIHKNWNGVGNGTLHHANVGVNTEVIQVYQSGNNSFKAVTASSTSLAIGTAFMVQEKGTMTLGQASHALLAPKREASVQPTAIQIASEGKPFSDQLFISADETAGQGYNQGVDVAKAGNIGNVNVPQIWTNAYNSKLCAHEAQLINGEASYTLSLYAPADGTYTLTGLNIPEDYTLYLTYNGTMLTELNGTYTLDLNKGITTEYGLLLVETYKTPTGMEEISSQPSVFRKILRNGILYILHNGKIYNAQGARVE